MIHGDRVFDYGEETDKHSFAYLLFGSTVIKYQYAKSDTEPEVY